MKCILGILEEEREHSIEVSFLFLSIQTSNIEMV